MAAKIRMLNSFVIREFPWREHGTAAPVAQMWKSSNDLETLAQNALDRAKQIEASANYTNAGRQAEMIRWAHEFGAPVIRNAVDSLHAAEKARDQVRSQMKTRQVDKSDLAAAIRRTEIRTWLRGMDDAKRTAMFSGVEQLDPEIALAVEESPPELSGATREQRHRLIERSKHDLNPDAAKRIETIENAIVSLTDMASAAARTLQTVGVTSAEIDAMIGVPSASEKIAAIIAGTSEKAA